MRTSFGFALIGLLFFAIAVIVWVSQPDPEHAYCSFNWAEPACREEGGGFKPFPDDPYHGFLDEEGNYHPPRP